MTTQVLLEGFRPKDGRHIYLILSPWGYCTQTHLPCMRLSHTPIQNVDCERSAVGTPLEWPEAKKVAGHVREWGIEVSI